MRQRDRVIVMSNGDSDGAVPLIKETGQDDPRYRCWLDRRRLGKGGALIAGLRYVARSASPRDLVCFVDADGGITPSDLGWLCTRARSGELMIGSRWLDPSRQVGRQPLHQRMANRLFNRLVKNILKIDLADTQCPAKVMKVSDLSKLVLRLNQSGQEFDIDLLLAAREIGLEIREVPITWSYTKGIKRHMVTEGPAGAHRGTAPAAEVQALGLIRGSSRPDSPCADARRRSIPWGPGKPTWVHREGEDPFVGPARVTALLWPLSHAGCIGTGWPRSLRSMQ